MLLVAGGCAPAYRPPAPFVPLLQEEGDVNLAAQLGVGGGQVDAAYAASEGLAVRGGLQVAGFGGRGSYTVGTVGLGAYGANSDRGRWAVHVDLGGGASTGITEVQFTTSTGSGATSQQTEVFRNSGGLGLVAVRGEFGAEVPKGAYGTQIGITGQTLLPDDRSDKRRPGYGSTIEVAGFGRVGSPQVQFQGHFGVALPVVGIRMGTFVPVLLGIGFAFDLPKTPPPSPW